MPRNTIILPPSPTSPSSVYVAHAAGRVNRAQLQGGIARLRSAGWRVSHDASLGTTPGYLAGEDSERAADLVHGLTSPGIDAVLCARGGYGTMRLLPRLAQDLLRRSPRWLIGYSDVSALHLWAYQQGVATIHGPMVSGLHKHDDDSSVSELLDIITGGRPPAFTNLQSTEDIRVTAPLVGGNLSLLAAMAATPYWPDAEPVLLFIEEVGEPLYRLDRMIQTLILGHHLDHVVGVVLGQFTGCGGDGSSEAEVVEWVTDLLRPLGVPIVSGASSGHGAPNTPWVHGLPYTLLAAEGRLVPAMIEAERTELSTAPFVPSRVRSTPGNLSRIIRDAHERGIATAISLDVSVRDEVLLRSTTGTTGAMPDVHRNPVTPATRFDLASLTKALCTAIVAHFALQEGHLSLDDRVPSAISLSQATLRDLLRHTSGLPAWLPIFEDARSADDPAGAARAAFAAVQAETVGTPRYSDVGYIALGRWLEEAMGAPLEALFERIVAEPLGLRRTGFRVEMPERALSAATEWCPWRGATLSGIVHDENAQVLGGVAGHAGLFGTAAEVGKIGRSLLGFGPRILDSETIARMWDRSQMLAEGTHTLGWDTPSGKFSSAGDRMSRTETVGHLGFTGTSIWLDRSRDLSVVLLTNRVHPHRDESRIRQLRRALHDEVVALVDELRG